MQQQLIEQFIRERMYFKNVTPKTALWYRHSFHAFDGATDSKTAIGDRIVKLRGAGVSAISVKTYLRAINAYFRWMQSEGYVSELIRIPKLKEEQKVLATPSPLRTVLWPPSHPTKKLVRTVSPVASVASTPCSFCVNVMSALRGIENTLGVLAWYPAIRTG